MELCWKRFQTGIAKKNVMLSNRSMKDHHLWYTKSSEDLTWSLCSCIILIIHKHSRDGRCRRNNCGGLMIKPKLFIFHWEDKQGFQTCSDENIFWIRILLLKAWMDMNKSSFRPWGRFIGRTEVDKSQVPSF